MYLQDKEREENKMKELKWSSKLIWVVINPDGTYAGAPCVTWEEALELSSQREGRRIYIIDIREDDVTNCKYGGKI